MNDSKAGFDIFGPSTNGIMYPVSTSTDYRFPVGEGLDVHAWPEDHPDRDALLRAKITVKKLSDARSHPETNEVYLGQIDHYISELNNLSNSLLNREHRIAFIGKVGVGKSTAICKLTDLLIKGRGSLGSQCVLATGPGRTTVCEVQVRRGEKFAVHIKPRSEEEIRGAVKDFVHCLRARERTQSGDSADTLAYPSEISTEFPCELEKVIRNMSALASTATNSGAHEDREPKVDPAVTLAERMKSDDELIEEIIRRMNLASRKSTVLEYPTGSDQLPLEWLKKTFREVNFGTNQELSIPEQIEIRVVQPVLGAESLELTIIDSRGLDRGEHQREDIDRLFDDDRTLTVLSTSFPDAPDALTRGLLLRVQSSRVQTSKSRSVILVIPKNREAESVTDDSGESFDCAERGYAEKKRQIETSLIQQKLFTPPILFFDASADDWDVARSEIVGMVMSQRRSQANRILQISSATETLLQNLEDEHSRRVFSEVRRRLSIWFRAQDKLELSSTVPYEGLLELLEKSHHQTIKVAIRERGESLKINYYNELGMGVRVLAAQAINPLYSEFKGVTKALRGDPTLKQSEKFLDSLLIHLESAINQSYRSIHSQSRDIYRKRLRNDHTYWDPCSEFCGKGFKLRVLEHTGMHLRSHHGPVLDEVRRLIEKEWSQIIGHLKDVLNESELRIQ